MTIAAPAIRAPGATRNTRWHTELRAPLVSELGKHRGTFTRKNLRGLRLKKPSGPVRPSACVVWRVVCASGYLFMSTSPLCADSLVRLPPRRWCKVRRIGA